MTFQVGRFKTFRDLEFSLSPTVVHTVAAAVKVRTPGEIYGLMERGGQLRATGATRMNDTSSRSHAVFIIIVEQVIRSKQCRVDVQPEGFVVSIRSMQQRRSRAPGQSDILHRLPFLLPQMLRPKITVPPQPSWMRAPR